MLRKDELPPSMSGDPPSPSRSNQTQACSPASSDRSALSCCPCVRTVTRCLPGGRDAGRRSCTARLRAGIATHSRPLMLMVRTQGASAEHRTSRTTSSDPFATLDAFIGSRIRSRAEGHEDTRQLGGIAASPRSAAAPPQNRGSPRHWRSTMSTTQAMVRRGSIARRRLRWRAFRLRCISARTRLTPPLFPPLLPTLHSPFPPAALQRTRKKHHEPRHELRQSDETRDLKTARHATARRAR